MHTITYVSLAVINAEAAQREKQRKENPSKGDGEQAESGDITTADTPTEHTASDGREKGKVFFQCRNNGTCL